MQNIEQRMQKGERGAEDNQLPIANLKREDGRQIADFRLRIRGNRLLRPVRQASRRASNDRITLITYKLESQTGLGCESSL